MDNLRRRYTERAGRVRDNEDRSVGVVGLRKCAKLGVVDENAKNRVEPYTPPITGLYRVN